MSNPKENSKNTNSSMESICSIRKSINTLGTIIRDNDSNSNTITRFDEISKLLFLKAHSDKNQLDIFSMDPSETECDYFRRISECYGKLIEDSGMDVPDQFIEIKMSREALMKCGQKMNGIVLSNTECDMKGMAYEETIRRTFDCKDNQQFFTPYQIIDFIVELTKNRLHGKICDPACGTGGFLTKISKKTKNQELIGFEIDERLAWISRLNMFIHDERKFSVLAFPSWGSLGDKVKPFFNSIDAILTNPPFGSDYTDKKLLDQFELGKNKPSRRRGVLFIEQSWNLLKENGLLAMVIDQGVLNAQANRDVRQYILTHYRIKAIVELPETAFMPYATVKSSIMILEKTMEKAPQTNVFYAKSEKIGRKKTGDDDFIYSCSKPPELNSDLPSIIEKHERYLSGNLNDEENCFIANLDQSMDENQSLRIDYAYHHPIRKRNRELMEKSLCELKSLKDLCNERNQSMIPSESDENSIIPYTSLTNIDSFSGKAIQVPTPSASIKSSVKRYERNDIVFAKMRPELRKAAVMDFNDGGYVSSECSVLTVKKDSDGKYVIDPNLLSAILRSDFVFNQIMSDITGIGRPRINQHALMRILVPFPDREMSEKTMESLNSARESIRKIREKARILNEKADEEERESVNEITKKITENQK